MYVQQYLPIMQEGRKEILGVFDLGENVFFEGDEVAYTLPDAAAGADNEIVLQEYIPEQSVIRPVSPGFMIAVFDHETVFNKGHRGYACFIDIKDMSPATTWSSGSGLANQIRVYDGPIIEGLENKEGWAINPPAAAPVNTIAPAISGLLTIGSLLTSTPGTWTEGDAVTYQWQRSIASVWTDIALATNSTFTTADAGQHRCVVTNTNVRGATAANSNVLVIA